MAVFQRERSKKEEGKREKVEIWGERRTHLMARRTRLQRGAETASSATQNRGRLVNTERGGHELHVSGKKKTNP